MSPAAGRLLTPSMLRLAHSTNMKYGAETSAPCAAGRAELLRPSLAAAEALNGASRCCACWRPSGPATDRPHGELGRSDSDRLRSGHVSQSPGISLSHFDPVPEDQGEEQTGDPHANHDQAGFRDIHLSHPRQGGHPPRIGSDKTGQIGGEARQFGLAKAMRTCEELQELQRMLQSAAHRSSRAPTVSCDLFYSRSPAASRASSQVANERRWTTRPPLSVWSHS
jgi:hypothetical protein